MRAKMAHLRSHIGDLEPIHQGEDPSIEGSQCFRSTGNPYLARIFPEGDIAPIMQPIFNGLITNDKFCLSRTARLHLSWWRLPRSARQRSSEEVQSPVEDHVQEYLPQQETYEKTTMDSPAQLPGTA